MKYRHHEPGRANLLVVNAMHVHRVLSMLRTLALESVQKKSDQAANMRGVLRVCCVLDTVKEHFQSSDVSRALWSEVTRQCTVDNSKTSPRFFPCKMHGNPCHMLLHIDLNVRMWAHMA